MTAMLPEWIGADGSRLHPGDEVTITALGYGQHARGRILAPPTNPHPTQDTGRPADPQVTVTTGSQAGRTVVLLCAQLTLRTRR
jgi:hypothetical protein